MKNGKEQVFKPVFGSIAELLEHHKEKFGAKDAIIGVDVDSGKEYRISYDKLAKLAHKTARFLSQNGVKKSDRIAFAFENTASILLLELGAGLLGASCVPLDVKRDTEERKRFKIQDAGAKLVFQDEQELLHAIEHTSLAESLSLGGSLKDEYILLYTSGTTANPKGVPLTLRAFFANAEGIIEWQKLSSDTRFLVVLPLHHVNSTTMSLATLLAGGTIILASRYSASRFWDMVADHYATITSVVPTILHDLLNRKGEFFSKKRNLSSLKRILVGSAPVLPKETLRFMETFGVDVVQGYGQTETALRVTGVPVDLPRELYVELTRKNSIGKELVFCNVTVLTQDGKEAGEGEEGEICIRGPVLGDGYLNNPEETEKAFSHGWFHSGDLGFYSMVSGEKYFFMKGRIKEIISKGGIKISPAAVEDALLKNFPEIDELCVVGYPDARMGEEVAVVVKMKEGFASIGQADMKKLENISVYETPVKVFVIEEEIPKTSTGKIQRVKVKEMVAEWMKKEKTEHLYCRLIGAQEKEILEKAVEINNKRWQVASNLNEFELRAENGYLIGVFNAEGKLLGTLSALQITKEKLEKVKTWDAATGRGTLKTHDSKGDALLCVSITVDSSEETPNIQTTPSQELADTVVKEYVSASLDNVIRFHRKSKGGMEKGGEVTNILPQGRPEDTDAMGYNVLIEYPDIGPNTKIVKTKNASPSILLIEQAMLLAKEKGCSKVVAFSRPAQLRLHLAKALDDSIPFEPHNAEEFASFAKLVVYSKARSI